MKFDPKKFIDAAKADTGVSKIYNDSFEEGLEMYCRSLSHCEVLNAQGEATVRGLIANNLANRLRVDAYWYTHPELAEQQIVQPMLVMGMLRTGTTLTVDLIARDPAKRCLYGWEVDESVPPPVLSDMRNDARFIRRHQQMAAGQTVMIKEMHWEEADDPTECVFLLGQDFKSAMIEAMAPMPEYSEWLAKVSFKSAYEYHKRALQLLQSKSPGTWILKAPNHASQIYTIKEIYPDARIVVNHRQPETVVASTLSIFEGLYKNNCTSVDVDYLRDLYVPITRTLCTQIMKYRDEHGSADFYDLYYEDLRKDKLAAIEQVYTRFGETLSAEARERMQRFLAHQQQGEGARKYSLEDYGMTAAEVREMFADYIDYYNV